MSIGDHKAYRWRPVATRTVSFWVYKDPEDLKTEARTRWEDANAKSSDRFLPLERSLYEVDSKVSQYLVRVLGSDGRIFWTWLENLESVT